MNQHRDSNLDREKIEAMMPIVVTILICICVIGVFVWFFFSNQTNEKIEQTKATIAQVANNLDRKVNEAGGYIRVERVEQLDAWENELEISYYREVEHSPSETLTVRSAGPDQIFNTEDDISTTRGNVIARNVLREPARGAVGGLADGVRDLFKKEED